MINPSRNDTVIASVTLTKKLPNRRSFSATAQLIHLEGNERPYFSVTGEERNLRRIEENQVESGGQMHDVVMKHFPELAPIIALHLADDNGWPVYAVENGTYWLGFGTYKPKNWPDYSAFARLWRITEEEARTIHGLATMHHTPADYIKTMAGYHADRWTTEAVAGVALIRKLADEND